MSRDALVVGINSYSCDRLSNLKAPAEDAEKIAQLLHEYGEFQVKRLPSVKDKQNNKPSVGKTTKVTLTQLKEAIVQLFKPEGKSVPDTALLFFSGHGLRENLGVSQGFLATSDVDPESGKWGLSLDWLRKVLQSSPVRQQIVILDCCYSGEFLNFDEADPGDKGKGRDRCFIAASREFEKAYEELGSTHSVLTSALLKGLEPKQDRWVTNHSLADFLNQERHSFSQHYICHNFGEVINLTRHFVASPNQLPASIEQQTICPYRGLTFFDCNDEDPKYFYGRKALIDQMLQKIRSGNFLAILGASGSGKSSVVRAGLLHQLKLGRCISSSNSWQIHIFKPGERPFENLIKAFIDPNLSDIDRADQLSKLKKLIGENAMEGLENLITSIKAERVVLVVDQFEEVFTLCQNVKLRQKFFECLLGALERLNKKLCLVLTMRADFFGKCAEQDYAGLAKKIEDNLVMVTPMKKEELQQAITKPAEQVGLEVEPELVSRMLEDMEGSSGSLPLLQYTLTELWKHRRENKLTVLAYAQLGGVKETLQKRATEFYKFLPSEEQKVAKGIFLELTQLGEGTEDTRRRVFLKDLVTPQQSAALVERVVQKLANENLVVTSTLLEKGVESNSVAVVDIAHESLIRHWSILRDWVNNHREAIRTERRIEAAAQEWEIQGKPAEMDYLLQGRKLIEAQNYLKDYLHLGLLSSTAQEFIQVSQAADDRRRIQEEERQRREQQQEKERERQKLAAAEKLAQETEARRKAEEEARRHAEQRAQEEEARRKAEEEARRYAEQRTQEEKARRKAEEEARQHAEQRAQEEEARRKAEEKASRETTVRLKQAGIILRGSLIAGVLLTGLSIFAGLQWLSAQTNEVGALSSAAEARVSSNQEADDLDALMKALQAGKKLKQISIGNPDLHARVKEKLQKVVYGVKERNRFQGHESVITSVSFSPDGQFIVSGGYDGTVRLWNLKGEQLDLHQLDSQMRVTSLSFSHDNTLATGGRDGSFHLWQLQDNKLKKLSEFRQRHSKQIVSIRFSPDGKTLATASDDGTAGLWDLQGKKLLEFTEYKEPNPQNINASQPKGKKSSATEKKPEFKSVSFSPDGNILATAHGGDNGKVLLWDLKNRNNKKPLLVYDKHVGSVLSVSFSPDGKVLASAGNDSIVRLWNLQGEWKGDLQGHQGEIRNVSFSPNGEQLATVGDDSIVRVWNLKTRAKTREELKGHHSKIWNLSFSPDGKQLATVGHGSILRLWNLEGKEQSQFKGRRKLWSVNFSPKEEKIMTSGHDGTARLWDLENKQQLAVFQVKDEKGAVKKDLGVVWNASFSPDGQFVATASEDKTARLWNLKGEMLQEFKGHQDEVMSVSFSPTEQKLATGSKDGTVRLWDFQGKLLKTIPPHKDDPDAAIFGVSFSPDGKLLAAANGKASTARLWNLEGQHLAEFKGIKPNWVLSIKFSPDGKQLVSVGDDGTAYLWNLQGQQIGKFSGHTVAAKSVSFSPDGKLLATVSSDRTAILWDVESKQQLAKFRGHQGGVESVSFSPDGKRFATAGEDGTARIWSIESLDELMVRGCRWVGDYLKNNSHLSSSDRNLCHGIDTSKS